MYNLCACVLSLEGGMMEQRRISWVQELGKVVEDAELDISRLGRFIIAPVGGGGAPRVLRIATSCWHQLQDGQFNLRLRSRGSMPLESVDRKRSVWGEEMKNLKIVPGETVCSSITEPAIWFILISIVKWASTKKRAHTDTRVRDSSQCEFMAYTSARVTQYMFTLPQASPSDPTHQNGEYFLHFYINREPLLWPLNFEPMVVPDCPTPPGSRCVRKEAAGVGEMNRLTPFYSSQKVCHQAISAQAEVFKWIWW